MKTNTAILFYLIFSSCATRDRDDSVVLARVGDQVLTVNRLEAILPARERTNTQMRSFINEWVDYTLLYDAAIKDGFHLDESLISAQDRYFKRLIVMSFIQAEVSKGMDIKNDEVRDYYDSFSKSFTRVEDEALIYHFITDNLSEAREIRSTLNKERSGDVIDELFDNYNVEAKTVTKGFLVKKLDHALFSKASGVLHGPLRTKNGYHIIKVIKRYKKGSQKGYASGEAQLATFGLLNMT